jgi:hypothetical protein
MKTIICQEKLGTEHSNSFNWTKLEKAGPFFSAPGDIGSATHAVDGGLGAAATSANRIIYTERRLGNPERAAGVGRGVDGSRCRESVAARIDATVLHLSHRRDTRTHRTVVVIGVERERPQC